MLNKINNWLISFVQLQLIITLFSLPIFILWGLTISYGTLVGNLIFSPLLMVFIGFCCAITFCEIIGIPHAFFNFGLEQVSDLWYFILSLSSPSWLTGCSLKSFPIVLLCCVIFYFIHSKYNPTPKKQILWLTVLLTIIFASDFFLQQDTQFQYDHMHVVRCKNHTFCIDNGNFSKKRSAQSWIDYTLLTDLVKYTGTPHIDTFISFKNNKRTYYAAKLLERQAGVKKIYLPKMLTIKPIRSKMLFL